MTLTIKTLRHVGAFAGMTSGEALISRFCDAVDAGEAPTGEDLRAVAAALAVLKNGRSDQTALLKFAKRLGIAKKQGKARTAKMNEWRDTESVVRYLVLVDTRINAGEHSDSAEIEARRDVAKELGIGDRAMRERIRKHGALARALYSALG